MPVTRSFDVFFDLRLNKRLSKQSWGWWFETLSRPLWRHRNVRVIASSFVFETTVYTKLYAQNSSQEIQNKFIFQSDKLSFLTWWRHQMETFSALLAISAGNSLVTGEFPSQRPVARSFDVSLICALNKRLSKQSWGWWFEMQSRPLWRHRNELTLWGRDKMATVSQTTLSNAYSLMKMLWFRLKFHWSLFPRFKLAIFQHWFR